MSINRNDNNIYGKDTSILIDRLNKWRYGMLDLSNLHITCIPWFPYRLKKLNCSNTQIKSLKLPISIEWLDCSNTLISSLKLPISIEWLDCSNTSIIFLKIPNNLEFLNCSKTKITSLEVPHSFENLICDFPKLQIKVKDLYIKEDVYEDIWKACQ